MSVKSIQAMKDFLTEHHVSYTNLSARIKALIEYQSGGNQVYLGSEEVWFDFASTYHGETVNLNHMDANKFHTQFNVNFQEMTVVKSVLKISGKPSQKFPKGYTVYLTFIEDLA